MYNLTPREKRQVINLGNKITEIEKLQKASHIAPRLPYSSVPQDKPLVVTDQDGNVVDVLGSNPDEGKIILPGKPPAQPSIPGVTAYLGTVTVSWDGLYAEEGYIAPDLKELEVHGATDEDFEPSSATLIGSITNRTGGTSTAALEYGTWYFRLIAVSTSNARSIPSDMASAEVVPLVEVPEMTEVLDDINERYDGVVTEAQQLNDKLTQAEQVINSTRDDLDNLENVRLPQVEANIEAAHQEIVSTGAVLGSKLEQAQTDLAEHETRLDSNESSLNTLNNTTLPQLRQDMEATETLLQGLDGRLGTAETELDSTRTELNSKLDSAFIKITDADGKAQSAIDKAATAQGKADQAAQDALSATGIANSKGKALIQSTAPAVADRNSVTLWIDTTSGANTPKRWNGSAWVEVTDKAAKDAATAAANAQSKAQEALSAAGSAQSTADNALTMAGSKSKVFYSTSAPSGTGTAVNDLWRRVDASKNVIGEWYWTGSSWQSSQITTEAISNLDVGKLTAGSAAFSEGVVEKLWAEVIRAKKIMADQVMIGSGSNLIVDPYFENGDIRNYRQTSSSLAGNYGTNTTLNLRWFGGTQSATSTFNFYFHSTPGRDTPDAMFPVVDGDVYRFKGRVNAVGGKARWNAREYLKDGTFRFSPNGFGKSGYWHSGSSGQIMEDTYTPADNVEAFIPYVTWEASTTSAHVYAGASVTNMTDGSLVVAGSITGDHIEANSVAAKVGSFVKINANQITAGTVSTDRLNVNDIAAKTAAFQTVDVKNLFTTTGTMSEAVINKLYTDVVRSRKITTDQLLVGQGENLVPWNVSESVPQNWEHISGYGGGATNPGRQSGGGVVDNDHLYMVADWVTPGTDTITWRMTSRKFDNNKSGWVVEPGEEFVASVYIKAGGSYTTYPNIRLGIWWYNAAGGYISSQISEQSLLTWTWSKIEVHGKAPATAAYALVYIRQDQPGGLRVDLPSLYRKKGAFLIVDGAIEAKHITASESMSAKIGQFLKLDVKDLTSTGTSTLNEAVVDKLWTDVVHSRKITSDMVLVGAGNNLIPNSALLEDLSGWENSVASLRRTVGANGPTATTPYMYVTTNGNVRSTRFTVTGGKDYRFSMSARAAAAGSIIFVQINTNGASNPYAVTSKALTTSWSNITGTVKLPEDATTAYVNIYVNHSSGSVTTQSFAYMAFNQMSDGELIVDGSITATKILANSIEAGHIKSNAITADKIEAGAIKAQHIDARQITADKLLVGQGSNVYPDPLMLDVEGWPSSNATVSTGGYGSSNRVRITAGTGQTGAYYGNASDPDRRFPVIPGRTYRLSVWIRPTVNISANNVIAVYTRLGAKTGTSYTWPTPSAITNNEATTGVSTIPASTWTKMEGNITIPTDATNTFMIPGLYLQAGFPTGSSCDFSNLNISEAVTGELIVDGAIDGKTITGALIQTDKESNVGVKLSNSGIEAYSPQGEKTFSITAGQGVDYIGVWGSSQATIDDNGNILYPSGVEPEQMASLDYLGGMAGSELSVSDYARMDGNVVINGDPLQASHLGTEAPGEWGPVINGRSLLGSTFTNFVDQHPQVTDGISWLTPLAHGFKANAFVNDDTNRSTGKAGGLSSDNRWKWSGKSGGLVDRMMLQQQIEVVNNRGYFLTYSVPAVRSTDGGSSTVGATVVRYSTGSLNVNTGSTLNDTRVYIPGGGNYFNPTKAVYFVGGQDVPAGTITFGIQVYVYDNRTMETTDTADARYWNLSITDMGLATKGSTGKAVDLFRKLPIDTTPEETSTPPPAPKPDPVRYTKTWNANWWGTYDSSGTNSYYESRGRVAQGDPPGSAGIQRGVVGFPSVTGTLSGATVKKVEIYVYAAHWYSSAGGTLIIGTHGLTSKPSSYSSGDIDVKRQDMKKPEGRWITLPSSVHAGFKSGSLRGVQFYTGNSSLKYYGYLTGSKTKIRVTYEK